MKTENEKNRSKQIFLEVERNDNEPSKTDSDTCWRAFKNGSLTALKVMYDSNIKYLFNYGVHLCSNEEITKDNIHDLFIEIWEKRKNLGDIKNVRIYLMVSLRRKILAYMKKRVKFESVDDAKKFDVGLSSTFHQMISSYADQTLIESIEKLIKELPEKQKEAIYLRFHNQLSCKEISNIMGINVQSVYNHIHRALQLMRHHMLQEISKR